MCATKKIIIKKRKAKSITTVAYLVDTKTDSTLIGAILVGMSFIEPINFLFSSAHIPLGLQSN